MLRYIIDTFKYVARTTRNSMLYPFLRLKYQIRTKLAVKSKLGTLAAEKIRKLQGYLLGKPKSLKDYVEFKRYYVAKTLIIIAAILCVALPVLFYFYGYPFLVQRFGTAVFIETDKDLEKYSGKVKVFTEGQKLIYHGELKNGKSNGKGSLYDSQGRLAFEGSFIDGLRQGEGVEYYPEGMARIKGQFNADYAEGTCVEYYIDGTVKYEGEFMAGRYNGQGRLNWENGKQKYVGQFINGNYSGQGSSYDTAGNLVYEGEFKEGKYSGSGVAYDNSSIAYEGMFLDGMRHGKGRLYKGGKLLYDGDFIKGQYSGIGRLYDVSSSNLVYEGEFMEGKYSGSGTLFSKDGIAAYTGNFTDSEISYTSLLGLNDTDIRAALGKKFRTDMLTEGFIITSPDAGISVCLNYYDEALEAKALSVITRGTNKALGIQPGMSIEQIKSIIGEPVKFGKASIREHEQAALQAYEIYSVYRAEYVIGDIPVTFCFEKKDEKWLYAVIGS